MKFIFIISLLLAFKLLALDGGNSAMYKKLTPEEERVIIYKGTERPFTGQYYSFKEDGTYLCKQCGSELFSSDDKFESGYGWPSFDDQIEGAVKFLPDADGRRTEIQCVKCGAHLGHIFEGEGFTPKNARNCVNSISLDFQKNKTKEIVIGGGCFWCTEAVFQQLPGITKVTSGYSGGSVKNPTYEQVCEGDTGHAEVIKIQYDPSKVNLEKILELFFATHNPTTLNRQGADYGTQYRSVIFYKTSEEKAFIEKYIEKLKDSYSDPIVTEVSESAEFYEAENYHQNYYNSHKNQPYCSVVIAPKVKKANDKINEK